MKFVDTCRLVMTNSSNAVATQCAQLVWRHTVLNLCGDTVCSTSVATHCAERLWRHNVRKASFVTVYWMFWIQSKDFWL
jgi:uncharacterized membrane protein YsdA (DUF1294 family)